MIGLRLTNIIWKGEKSNINFCICIGDVKSQFFVVFYSIQ